MRTKLAHHLLLAVASTFALSVNAFASHEQTVELKIKGVSSTSHLARAFGQNPSEAYRKIETLLKEKADEAADLENTTIKAKVPLFSATAQAFYQDPASALSTIEDALQEKADAAINHDQLTLKFSVFKNTATARAFQLDPEGAVVMAELAFIKAEEANKSAEREARLSEAAAKGDYTAIRKLAKAAGDDKTALKWHFVELLMSFGESFQYPEMARVAGELSAKAVDGALVEAARWLSAKRYVQEIVDEKGPTEFSQIFNEFFAKGQVESFFFHAEKLHNMDRMLYLQFFKWLGIEETNLKEAQRCLQETAKRHHSASRDLIALLAHLRNIEGVEGRQALLSTSMSSKRPIMQHVNKILMGEDAAYVPQRSFEDSIASLRKTLKINE